MPTKAFAEQEVYPYDFFLACETFLAHRGFAALSRIGQPPETALSRSSLFQGAAERVLAFPTDVLVYISVRTLSGIV